MLRRQHAQSSLEIILLICAVAAALTGMAIYVQRGYQGYLRNSSQAHGLQFDPKSFSETRQLNAYNRNQTVDVTSAEASVPSLGGVVPGRMLTTKVKTVTDWDVQRNGIYEAN